MLINVNVNDRFGEHMQYSCGYWKDAKNLKEAQEAKMDLIAKKLKLKPGRKSYTTNKNIL
jgi:cyclopropane fatty-acyl-phospholipid synthase-like methyltransferase